MQGIISNCFTHNHALFIKGAAGIGKSEGVAVAARQHAKKLGRHFVEWVKLSRDKKRLLLESKTNREMVYIFLDKRIAQSDPSDLKGIPFREMVTIDSTDLQGNPIKVQTSYTSWLPNMDFLVLTLDGAAGIIFFDEMNLAPPMVQGAAYQIVLDRAIGEISFKEDVVVIGAGNRACDKANVYEMAGPLKNRFRNIQLAPPTANQWIGDYALPKGKNGDVIAFLGFRPELMMEGENMANGGNTSNVGSKDRDNFCTHRSWTKCADVLDDFTIPQPDGTQATKKKIDDVLRQIEDQTATCIGDGTAAELTAFIKLRGLISIADIVKHPAKLAMLGVDVKYSILNALANEYDKQGNKFMPKIIPMLDPTILDADFAVILIRMCGSKNARFFSELAKHPSAQKHIDLFCKYI